ncbi:MAG TPA: sensor histidine kinase [Anaerolineaceae bacterium]|nr:sensor histidine kinase [Anaerolineaceae bacterium]
MRLILAVFPLVAGQFLPRFRFQRSQPYSYLAIGETLILMGYLSWPWLQKRLGKWYIPIALGIATVAPILETYLAVDLRFDEISQVRAFAGQWQLVIFLLVPLILVSWLYDFRVVAAYVVLLVLQDVAFFVLTPLVRMDDVPLWPLTSVALVRTGMYLLVGYAVSHLAEEQRQQNAQLAEANRRLSAHATTLEQLTISRERNRMARELHDTLAHTLSAVAVQLEAVHSLWDANHGEARTMLERSLVVTREGLHEARRAIQALRTVPLEDLGFELAIRNLAQSMAERGSLKLDLQIPDELPGLDAEIQQSLYRITEEALRNVVQHAGAHQVSIVIEKSGSRLDLIICDDGHGLRPEAEQDGHYGLRGMQERAEAIGALLFIESQPDHGTTVRLHMEAAVD